MKHIGELIIQFILMVWNYIAVLLVLLFDALIFGYFLMLINNNILVRLYSIPIINYFDSIGILFLIKLITLMIKSVNVSGNNNIILNK